MPSLRDQSPGVSRPEGSPDSPTPHRPLFEALGWDVGSTATGRPAIPRKSFSKTAWTWKASRRPRITPFASAPCRSSTPKPRSAASTSARTPPRPTSFAATAGAPSSPLSILTDFEELGRLRLHHSAPRRATRRAMPESCTSASRSTPTAGGNCGTSSRAKPSGPGRSTSTPRPSGSAARPKWTWSF